MHRRRLTRHSSQFVVVEGVNSAIRTLFLQQGGVIHRRQALEAGLTSRQLDRLTGSGEWLVVRRGIYRLHAAAPLPETNLWATFLWLGDTAVLLDDGAAWWRKLVPDAPAEWVFASPLHRRVGVGARLVDVHVDTEDRTTHRGVAVLTPAWAALRTAATLERDRSGAGIALVDRLTQTRKVAHAEMATSLERHPGCRGAAGMRRLLARTGDGAHSELERLAVSLLRQAGIAGFALNHRTTLSGGRRVEIDIAFVDRRVAIELDGYAFHSSPQAFREDLRRANLLMDDGWTVRRFGYGDLLTDPESFVALVRDLLRG